MSEPLTRLRALLERSFGAVPRETTPEAHVQRLCRELDACFAELLDREAPVPFDELTALADGFRDRGRTLPASVERAHLDWLTRDKGWYKLVAGPDGRPRAPELPAGAPSAPLTLAPRLYERVAELRYELHRRAHPGPCDCAALVAGGRFREPRSPELRPLGPATDGSYFGDKFLCGACGARWFRGVGDDDRGTTFWEPSRDS